MAGSLHGIIWLVSLSDTIHFTSPVPSRCSANSHQMVWAFCTLQCMLESPSQAKPGQAAGQVIAKTVTTARVADLFCPDEIKPHCHNCSWIFSVYSGSCPDRNAVEVGDTRQISTSTNFNKNEYTVHASPSTDYTFNWYPLNKTVTLYKCVYNAFWMLGLSKVLPYGCSYYC